LVEPVRGNVKLAGKLGRRHVQRFQLIGKYIAGVNWMERPFDDWIGHRSRLFPKAPRTKVT
jgi:hypothetical protein